ncbi:MAG TPA: hypothetical protein VJP90_09105 [Paenarthrobacter sp.]|nr:hypothetical protein [Paenarthrobacter sp.]
MVSLGVFTIRAGINLTYYPVVDIFDQPYNRNPTDSATASPAEP